jgi:hypothetical protein
MATGGIFQLITNDGKQDRMLMASALLKSRIDNARKTRIERGDSDPTPTLYDIERTHILFTNAHFKPFAAIGYEYNKVTNSAGSASINSNTTSKITFSIPQFGDFFCDMVVHAVIQQPTLTTVDTANVAVDPSKQNLMRWCSYPGERLLKNVKFEVNGNPLDEYTSDAVNFHRELSVQPGKELGWDRCVGQQEREVGWLNQPNWANSGVSSSSISSQQVVETTSGHQTPTGQVNVDGGIKSTTTSGDLELFIPLLFWCNKDPRLAVPSVAIPYGQRFITLELAPAVELVGEVPRGEGAVWETSRIAAGGTLGPVNLKTIELYINNIFVNPEVHNIFIKRIGFTLIRVHRQQSNDDNDGGANKSILLQNLKWPIEALFVGMRIKEYSQGSDPAIVKKHLDKWHKFCSVTDTPRTTQGWKSQKSSVLTGTTIDGVIPSLVAGTTFTVSAATLQQLYATSSVDLTGEVDAGDVLTFTNGTGGPVTWHVLSLSDDGLTVKFVEGADAFTAYDNDELVGAVDFTTAAVLVKSVAREVESTVQICEPTLKSVSIKAHGIPIYTHFPSGFYNAYIPLNYGGHNVHVPKDRGVLLITFCLYPGTYQPSGHINVSRAREFYIDYSTTSKIGNDAGQNTGLLVIVASAINFLLISDGSAVLRYST